MAIFNYLFFLRNSIFANEITIIELHNQSIDQALLNNLEEPQEDSELSEDSILDNNVDQENNGNVDEGVDEVNIEVEEN